MKVEIDLNEAMQIADGLFKVCRKRESNCEKCPLSKENEKCVFARIMSAAIDEINAAGKRSAADETGTPDDGKGHRTTAIIVQKGTNVNR